MTFQQFLERGETTGAIDYRLRINHDPAGRLTFYIRPYDRSGETGDFTVAGNYVTPPSRKREAAPMGDDLIERLRKPWDYTAGRRVLICEEAAARIAELEADLARLRAENEALKTERDEARREFADCEQDYTSAANRATAAEAKAARLAEMLGIARRLVVLQMAVLGEDVEGSPLIAEIDAALEAKP